MAKMTIREILDKVYYQHDILVFIRTRGECMIFDGADEVKKIPEEILNKIAKKRYIDKLKYITRVDIWC